MKRNFYILMTAVLILTACGSKAAAPSYDAVSPVAGGAAPAELNKAASGLMPESPVSADTGVSNPATAANPAQERIVIQNADLAIVVKDPLAKMTEIGALAKRLGGFVVASNMSQINLSDNLKVPEGSISIRVPAQELDTALNEIKANTLEIQSENRSGEDVTDKYVDLQSQLKAKQAAADKLYEIMQKTEKTDETLLVFNQLTQVQSDIEVLKGQITYYEQASALSAISVRLVAEQTIQPIVIAGWRPQGVARDAVQALIDFLQNFINFLIWLVIFVLPVGAILIALMAGLWRLLRWFWRKVFPRKTPPAAIPPAKTE
jgi:hypothetical protein